MVSHALVEYRAIMELPLQTVSSQILRNSVVKRFNSPAFSGTLILEGFGFVVLRESGLRKVEQITRAQLPRTRQARSWLCSSRAGWVPLVLGSPIDQPDLERKADEAHMGEKGESYDSAEGHHS